MATSPANTKFATVAPFVGAERLATVFAASATLATAGATIPANTGEIWILPSAACHWNPVGTATSTFAHAVRANEFLGPILPRHHAAAQIIGDGGAINVVIIYMRGSRPAQLHATTRPY